jgi:hypothetical protein
MENVVVRLSKGTFDSSILSQVQAKLEIGRITLEPALRELHGLRHYYVGIDETSNTMVNISIWDSLGAAKQMETLAAMLAQRDIFVQLGVIFDPICNYPTLWSINQ